VSALLEGHAAVNLLREAMRVIGALPLSACNDERAVWPSGPRVFRMARPAVLVWLIDGRAHGALARTAGEVYGALESARMDVTLAVARGKTLRGPALGTTGDKWFAVTGVVDHGPPGTVGLLTELLDPRTSAELMEKAERIVALGKGGG